MGKGVSRMHRLPAFGWPLLDGHTPRFGELTTALIGDGQRDAVGPFPGIAMQTCQHKAFANGVLDRLERRGLAVAPDDGGRGRGKTCMGGATMGNSRKVARGN
jgi:hypothetical protein